MPENLPGHRKAGGGGALNRDDDPIEEPKLLASPWEENHDALVNVFIYRYRYSIAGWIAFLSTLLIIGIKQVTELKVC